jgi:hypothetical protein
MSFASLEAAAPHAAGRFVLITDDISSDGNLLLHHYLALHLKSGRHVHLVAAEQSLFHYSSVAKKAGITLAGNPLFHLTNALAPPYVERIDDLIDRHESLCTGRVSLLCETMSLVSGVYVSLPSHRARAATPGKYLLILCALCRRSWQCQHRGTKQAKMFTNWWQFYCKWGLHHR